MAVKFHKKKSVVGRRFTAIKTDELIIPAGGLTEKMAPSQVQTIQTKEDLRRELTATPKQDDTISLLINRYYTDLNGNVLDKNLVPDSLKVKFPFYLFGLNDFNGAFKAGNLANPPINSVYFQKYIAGEGFDWFALQGGNIRSKYSIGDMVLIFADSYPNMNYLIFIIVTSLQQAYGSVLKDTIHRKLELQSINYVLDNANNYNERISFVLLNDLQVPKIDYYQPYAAFTPEQKQAEFITIPLKYVINPKLGLGSYIQFETELMQFDFKIKH